MEGQSRSLHDSKVSTNFDQSSMKVLADTSKKEKPERFYCHLPITSTRNNHGSCKKREDRQFRKAPQAPKRFKSSYIIFFTENQAKIKEQLGPQTTVADVSRRSSEIWRNLSEFQRTHWQELASKDKERYLAEKAAYTGPWQVPHKRMRKDPSAPKRPMS